ncbi:hypothetical protein SAMN05421805_103405 [Saccharopolyspora antimicrobica]|uniref:Uncharacterized protein n=1 Tax=Saccharopolyspora antimicrobica TaxID=455193 RepID=A0A1I4XEH3_9PSEU|nr:hypothetical protein [Saccharopolyspora antimicrobica]RKT84473.1 hypothetical protein ATL45_2788 [Saccharopolyspora antimicrobica]SFN24284.1 hypothetical protein SAMN05421805_103405 [Saccharopolyspora antimicrobica]
MPKAPEAVRTSILLWLIAIGAGVVETLLNVLPSPQDLLLAAAIRMLVYAALVALVLQLRHGRNWVRVTLAVLLGGVGLLSMVGPALAGGIELPAGPTDWVFLVVRIAHVLAVVGAVIAMFRPAANRFFSPA